MTKFNFTETYKKAEKKYNLGKGEYFKLKEGANKIRLVSITLPHEGMYKGVPNFKWLCQVLDRTDGKIKQFFMPNTIYRHIEALQFSDDYRFDEVPMPYDITITAIGAGTKEVKYTTTPARANTELTKEEYGELAQAPTVEELQTRIRESEGKTAKAVEHDTREEGVEEDIEVKNLPF